LRRYNLAGGFKLDAPLPPTIGHVQTTSVIEIYDFFLLRKNTSLIAEANKLIAQMLADVGKKLVPLICAASTKEVRPVIALTRPSAPSRRHPPRPLRSASTRGAGRSWRSGTHARCSTCPRPCPLPNRITEANHLPYITRDMR
jgi:hypothetical protein